MSEYVDFHYMPLEGKITGKQVLQQTEDAINDLGNKVYNLDVDEERIDEAIEKSEQAINTANSALAAVTTDRAVWKNTVAEMKATDIDLGVTAVTRGALAFNDGSGAFYGVRSEKSGDVESEDTVFLDNGNVAERIQSMNIIAKGNNIIFVANVAELIDSDALIGNVYGTTGYYSANDGGAGLYSIRTKTQSDVDDGGSIIFLDNGNVAELITDGAVNVKQFGAAGDGVTDDTKAIQNAVDFGQKIYFPTATYCTDTVTISRNIEVDCGESTFIATTTTNNLFVLQGTNGTLLTSQADYTANQLNYTLTDTTYNGLALIKGMINTSIREWSFFGSFNNGVLIDRFPYDIASISVQEVTPITCAIRNIAEVSFPNTHDGVVVSCQYGLNCVFENISVTNELFSVVTLASAYNCVVRNIYAELPMYSGTSTYTYPLLFQATTRCEIRNCYIHNPHWHCWTSDSKRLALYTTIDNCEFYSNNQYAVLDHQGGYGLLVKNSVVAGVYLGVAGCVKDCSIVSRNASNSNTRCLIEIPATVNKEKRIVENVSFYPGVNNSATGIMLSCPGDDNTDVPTTTKYISNIVLKDIYIASPTSNDIIRFDDSVPSSITSCVVENIIIDNCNCTIFDKLTTTKYDFANSSIIIKNINHKRLINNTLCYVYPIPGNVTIENSYFTYVTSNDGATYNNLTLNNVKLLNSQYFYVTNMLRGNNITVESGVTWTGTNVVFLTEVTTNNLGRFYSLIWRIDSAHDCYAKRMINSFTPSDVTLVSVA